MNELTEAQKKLANDLMELVYKHARLFADLVAGLIPSQEYTKHLDHVRREVNKLAAMAEVKNAKAK